MNFTSHFDAHTAIHEVTTAIDDYDGACDPDFDNDLQELERQFAEFRLMLPTE
jgi:hypothetical protein